MNQRSVIVLNMLFPNTLLKRDSRIMLVFKYLQLFLIKMVESGICDDQANQERIQGPLKCLNHCDGSQAVSFNLI